LGTPLLAGLSTYFVQVCIAAVFSSGINDLSLSSAACPQHYEQNLWISRHGHQAASWKNYGALLRGVYLRSTVLATVIGIASAFVYNAVVFGLPVIISSFLDQSMLTTILASLVLNLGFAFVGGWVAVRIVPKVDAEDF
jgi:hypothetical protein